ncbi:MAG: T9SS type A sorting domain-containing protein [Lewinellaceae bacterium]|nr:T9SS type A sorting domain-containing protein [Lewinellaceae bacterium]
MKKILFHYKILCLAVFLMLTSNLLKAQHNYKSMVSDGPASAAAMAAKKVRNSDGVVRYKLVQIAPDILKSRQISIELFDGETAYFDQFEHQTTSLSDNSWSGKSAGKKFGNLIITQDYDAIQASVFWGKKLYRIVPLEGETYLLLEIDNSNFPNEDCIDLKNGSLFLDKPTDLSKDPGDNPVGCNIRLLVAYTDAANTWAQNNFFTDALGLAQAAIAATNTSYNNSNVNFQVELAHLVRVGYTETGSFATDVDNFQDPSDGNMDEIHALRDLYRADLCVLITQGNSDCGRAYEIGADADEAFCAANASCCVGNFSFAHELGHLYGARHDPYVDGSSTPFSYGHGFVELSEQWRTVMSYNDECSDAGSSCTRLGFWSNPNVNHPTSGTAMGTTADNHNARVLNETGSALRGFRVQAVNHILSNTTLAGITFADLTAINSIIASNDYFLDPTATVQFRAGEFIRLSPGFESRAGSIFRASIEPFDPCPGGRPDIERDNDISFGTDVAFNLFPNPASDQVHITYFMSEKTDASMYIFNSLGRSVMEPELSNTVNQGLHQVDLDLSGLPDGIYWCLIRFSNGDKLRRAFVIAR